MKDPGELRARTDDLCRVAPRLDDKRSGTAVTADVEARYIPEHFFASREEKQ